jgi:hypothetical protein
LENGIEYLTLIEQKLDDCLEERSEISEQVRRFNPDHRKLYTVRIDELDVEIKTLWRKYRMLAALID